MRTLLLIAAVVLVFGIVRMLLTRNRHSGSGSATPPRIRSGDMVRCAHCGLHVPARESVREGDRHYCCEDHRRRSLEQRPSGHD